MSITQTIVANNSTKFNVLLLAQLIIAWCLVSATTTAHADELTTLDEAFDFVLSEQRVPHAEEVKLKEIHATYTSDAKFWIFTFIDASTTHVATVDQAKHFRLQSSNDKQAYNEVFWADRPRAEGMFKKDRLYEAENFIQSHNYVLTTPTIISFKVCEPPKGDIKSNRANGCLKDIFKETWTIVRGVKGRKLAKMVVYGDGQLDSFSNVTIERASR